MGCRHVGAPHRNVHAVGDNQPHVAIETGTRVPARLAFAVFQIDLQRVFSRADDAVEVDVERIVAVGPIDDLLVVDPHAGMAHRAVENECHVFADRIGQFERCAVFALSDERQAARAARFERLGDFAVLLDGRYLKVVLHRERPVDGPVVRDVDLLPAGLFGGFAAGEFPAFFQVGLRALCRDGKRHCGQCQDADAS